MTTGVSRARPLFPVRTERRREDYVLDRSVLDSATAAVVKVIDQATRRPGDTRSEVQLLRDGVAAACNVRTRGQIDSWAVAAALGERDIAKGCTPNTDSTFNYVQHMFRSEVPGIVGTARRGIYCFERSSRSPRAMVGRHRASTPSVQPCSTPTPTVRADAVTIATAARHYRRRKPVSALEATLGNPDDFAPSVAREGTVVAVPDMQAAAEKTRDATSRHQHVVNAIRAGGTAVGVAVQANWAADGVVKARTADQSVTWIFFEVKSASRDTFAAQIAAGVGQLHRRRTEYDFGPVPPRAYLAVDRIAGIRPEDLAWAASFTEQNDIQLVRLVEQTETHSFWFERIAFSN